MFERIKNIFRKKICLYLIYKNEDENSLVSVVEKKEDVDEFIRRSILIYHYKHFKAWCKLRNIDYRNPVSENYYISNFIETADEETLNQYTYVIKKAYYTRSSIAAILRMFNSCLPMGCSYETSAEDTYANLLYNQLQEINKKENLTDDSTK